MFRDGSDLTPLPYERRFEIAQALLKKSDRLLTAPLTKTDSAEELTRELLDNISRGLEGVVAKRLDSPYQAGARNFNWVKLKRNTSGQLNDTIDVVLLGYYRGKGKRAEFGAGALLAGVYDADRDEFVTISKLGTGLSDQGWRDIHQRLTSLEVPEKPARVNSLFVPDAWLKPDAALILSVSRANVAHGSALPDPMRLLVQEPLHCINVSRRQRQTFRHQKISKRPTKCRMRREE